MAKIAITNTPYLIDAVVNLLEDNSYVGSYDYTGFLLVNTNKMTFKSGADSQGRMTLDPLTDFNAIANVVDADLEPVHNLVMGASNHGASIATSGYAHSGQVSVPTVSATTYFDRVAVPALDVLGDVLCVGDRVIVSVPAGKKDIFNLPADGTFIISRITAKGAVGFDFDAANEFLAKRFEKVSVITDVDIASGDKVICLKNRRDGRFALPLDKVLTFRGLTVDKGNYILDNYPADQYAPSRFAVIV